MGLPVISTTLGCEGLEVADGEHLLIQDDPAGFAGAMIELLQNESQWRRLRQNGIRLVRHRYTWDHAFRDLEIEIRSIPRGH